MAETMGSTAPGGKTKKETKGGFSAVLVIVILIVIGLFGWAEWERRNTARELEQTAAQLEELRASTAESGEEQANEVLDNVKALIDIPLDPRPTVATINDIDRLKEANPFFEQAENGDYLILTGNRAILYDQDRNIVIDVAPFRITQTSPSPSPGSEGADGQEQSGGLESPTPTPEV